MPDRDFASADAVTSALGWLQGTVLGTLATAVAIIVVAIIGFLMLTGRVDVRRATQVIFGCFIIFGASTIAGGVIRAIASGRGESKLAMVAPPPELQPPPAVPRATSPYDPYAGAALPPR